MLSEEQTGLVMAAIRDRIEEHSSIPGLRYSQAIVNSGREAGASIEHPHGQLLGMSFVPRELAEEQAGFARFAGRCLLCTAADAEENVGHRVVYADERVLVICPFWSGSPYEMLVIPRTHGPHLHHSPPSRPRGSGPGAAGSARQVSATWWATWPTTWSSTPPPTGPRSRITGTSTSCPKLTTRGRLRARDRGGHQHHEPGAGRRRAEGPGAGLQRSDRRPACAPLVGPDPVIETGPTGPSGQPR